MPVRNLQAPTPDAVPLLEVKNLTVRFGGLTAVRSFNLAVESGQIVSIIGPNGAGKTTAFNAISGVSAPTEGRIHVRGRQLTRTLNWSVRLACLAVGLLTGTAAALLCVDLNRLWRATIKHNMLAPPEFATTASSYFRGDLSVEPDRHGGWVVVSPYSNRELGRASAAPDAGALALALQNAISGQQDLAAISSNGRWRVSVDEPRLDELRSAGAYIAWALAIGFAGGFVLGVGGAYAIWHRSRRSPDVVARGGIARSFQNIRLFQAMTVFENVLVGLDGAHVSARHKPASPNRRGLKWQADWQHARELLEFVGLERKTGDLAGSMAYGERRRLEIARALATQPELLLLDEPAAGMNPIETRELVDLIRQIRNRGVTIVLIEHHMNVVMEISDRVVVLSEGSKIAEGTPSDVKGDPAVIEAYLGKQE